MKIRGEEGRMDDFLKKGQTQNVIKNTIESLVRYGRIRCVKRLYAFYRDLRLCLVIAQVEVI